MKVKDLISKLKEFPENLEVALYNEMSDKSVATEKKLYFTKNERKVAKRDYKEMVKSNLVGFKHSLKTFQKEFVDAIVNNKRIRFNISNVILQ